MDTLGKILEEIKAASRKMVTAKVPHKYYRAIGTIKVEEIIRRHLESEPKRDHADNQITEYCPYCGEEITVWWDVEKDGYQIYCPNCGNIIMLCSMCDRVPCDWKEGDGCKHSDERYRQPNNSKWIPADKPPKTTDYVLLSFSNSSTPQVGRYERDEDGEGAYYISDEEDTCTSQDLYVNGWQPLPDPYRPEKRGE